MIVEFLSYCQLIAPPDERARHAGEFVLNTNQAQDSAYQLQLHGYVKNALKDLYTNPMFLACLGQDEESGRLAIEGFYPEVYLPLAHYSQLKELEGELVCPAEFGSRDLQLYNNRRQQLEAASKALQNLSFRSREILIQKLLKRSEFELAEQGLEAEEEVLIHDLFIWITKLAGELHQGTLMSQTIINIANPDQLIGGQNLFQKAYQEALQEIT